MNKNKWYLIVGMVICTLGCSGPVTVKSTEGTVFTGKQHEGLYWKALLHLVRGDKDDAIKIVAAIKSNDRALIASLLQEEKRQPIDNLFDDLFLTYVSRDPQRLSNMGLFESIGIRDHNAYLNDVSPDELIRNAQAKKAYLAALEKHDTEALSSGQKLAYDIFHWMLTHEAKGEKFLFHEYKVNQMDSVLNDLTTLLTLFHRLEQPEDAQNYVARLSKIPEQFKQTIVLLEYQKERGVLPPAFALEKVMRSISAFTAMPATENILYKHLASGIEKIQGVDRATILAQAQKSIQEAVYPAYQEVLACCKKLHEATGGANNGVWALPDGDAYYDYMLEHHNTTDLSADQIHALGLREVEKIHGEMRAIFALIGTVDAQKSVGELMQEMAKDARFYFPESEEGKQQCLAEFYSIIDRCRKELYGYFDIKPVSALQIHVTPKHEEEGMPGAYYWLPSLDGVRPGVFFVNLRDMKQIPKYEMETLAVHEAEPGHHFQLALQNETDMHVLRKMGTYNAHAEGWALYVEKLAYEQKFYSSPHAQLGHLSDELMRAVRLVVDTGIHKKRWTREQAVEYMVQATGMHVDRVVTEIERYFVLPGQACSYKVGQLKLLELRQRAKDVLGDKFDIRDFHNVVLTTASVPLAVLESVIDQWIASLRVG